MILIVGVVVVILIVTLRFPLFDDWLYWLKLLHHVLFFHLHRIQQMPQELMRVLLLIIIILIVFPRHFPE